MLKVIVGMRRKRKRFYIGINLIVISSSGYYVYAINLSWILIPNYCLKVYI